MAPSTRLRVRRPPARLRRVRERRAGGACCCPACCSRARCTGRWPRRSPSAATACSASTCSATATPTGRPRCANYSMTVFGRQAIALLDHVEVEQAVIGGTSLGANASLEAAAAAPERVKGLLIEMPVLDNALLGCALALHPAAGRASRSARRSRGSLGRGARLVPRGLCAARRHAARLGEPGPEAVRVGAPGPLLRPRGAARPRSAGRCQHKTLVIGHYRDPIHPFSDSDMLVRELPNARLVQASSILELRLTPERLTGEIVGVRGGMLPPRAARPRRPGGGRRRPASASERAFASYASAADVPPQVSRRRRCAASARSASGRPRGRQQRKRLVGYRRGRRARDRRRGGRARRGAAGGGGGEGNDEAAAQRLPRAAGASPEQQEFDLDGGRRRGGLRAAASTRASGVARAHHDPRREGRLPTRTRPPAAGTIEVPAEDGALRRGAAGRAASCTRSSTAA